MLSGRFIGVGPYRELCRSWESVCRSELCRDSADILWNRFVQQSVQIWQTPTRSVSEWPSVGRTYPTIVASLPLAHSVTHRAPGTQKEIPFSTRSMSGILWHPSVSSGADAEPLQSPNMCCMLHTGDPLIF